MKKLFLLHCFCVWAETPGLETVTLLLVVNLIKSGWDYKNVTSTVTPEIMKNCCGYNRTVYDGAVSNIIFNWHHLKWCSERRMAHFVRRCLSRLLSPRISSSPPLLTSQVEGIKEDEHPDSPFVILGTDTSFKLAYWDWVAGHSQEDRGDKEAQVREKMIPPPRRVSGCL